MQLLLSLSRHTSFRVVLVVEQAQAQCSTRAPGIVGHIISDCECGVNRYTTAGNSTTTAHQHMQRY